MELSSDVGGQDAPLDVDTVVLELGGEAREALFHPVGDMGWAREQPDLVDVVAIDLADEDLECLDAHVLLVPEDASAQLADDALEREDVREGAVWVELGLARTSVPNDRARDACDRTEQKPLAGREGCPWD